MSISNMLAFPSPQSLFYDHLEWLESLKNNSHSILPVSFKTILLILSSKPFKSLSKSFLPSVFTFSQLSPSLRWTSNSTIFYYQYITCASLRPVFLLPRTPFFSFHSSNPSQRNNTMCPPRQLPGSLPWPFISVILFLCIFFLPSHSAAAVWIFFIFSAHLFLNVSRRVCVCLCIIQKPHRYLLSNKWIMGTIVPPLNAQRFFPINYILTIFPSSFPLWRQ